MRRALSVLAVIVVLGAASPVSAAVPRNPSSWDFGTKIVRVFRGVSHEVRATAGLLHDVSLVGGVAKEVKRLGRAVMAPIRLALVELH